MPALKPVRQAIYGQFVSKMCLGKIIDNLSIGQFYKYMQENDARSSKEEFTRKSRENAQNVQEDMNTDENIAGTSHLNDIMEEERELEKLQEELRAQKEKYLRLFAEFDNFRKRSAKESLELRQTAGKEVIVSLLDTLDDCDRAEKQLQNAENIDQVKEGIQLVFSKLRSVLQSRGLKAMESIHTDFDVEKHEAITEIPVQDESLKGKVIDEVQKGYYLNDKIIRFAKVVVGK
jgi:molecular chaperone GrpE